MSLLSTLIPNAASDVVAVYDANFNPVFQDARAVKANVNEYAKVMEHPVEDGTTITDHKIILPAEIQLSLIVQSGFVQDTYQQIKQLFVSATLLTVQTKTSSYDNMIIMEMPHDEDPAMFDAVAIALKLKKVQFVTAQFGTLPPSAVKNKTQASTVNKGQLQPKDSNADKTSILRDIAGWGK